MHAEQMILFSPLSPVDHAHGRRHWQWGLAKNKPFVVAMCQPTCCVTQPVLGKSRPPVMGVEHLCPYVCETKLSRPLITQFPRTGSMNAWKKLGALDHSGLTSVLPNLNST